MKLLFISNLYPSAAEPERALYNRQLMKAISSSAEVRVIAPFAWFPGQGVFRQRTTPPVEEILDGIRVSHPRFFYTPGIFIHSHWRMYQRSLQRHFEGMLREFRPDHVMIGFAYPDGAAVAPLCREAGLSYSIRINGSDFLLRVRQKKFRDIVLQALREAPLVFCPGQALKQAMIAEGIDGSKIMAFENGVDSGMFKYRTKEEALKELEARSQKPEVSNKFTECNVLDRVSGLRFHPSSFSEARIILFVGNLVEVKGPDIMLEAFALLGKAEKEQELKPQIPTLSEVGTDEHRQEENHSDFRSQVSGLILLFIGSGRMRKDLEKRAQQLGIADSVHFLGIRPHEEVALWMNLADCLCLTSRSEGMPNAVIEALASGLPVVATDVGSVKELLENEPASRIIATEARGQRPEDGGQTTDNRPQLATLLAWTSDDRQQAKVECDKQHPASRIQHPESRNRQPTTRQPGNLTIEQLVSALAAVIDVKVNRMALAERQKDRFSWEKSAKNIINQIESKVGSS